MKQKILVISALLTSLISAPVLAENLSHLRRLLSTGECSLCDLRGAGLVMANLTGAKLTGADLSHANLSQANLTGADLSGADLSGTSLYGANLSGANLAGANLNGTDLRNAHLVGADLTAVNLNNSYVEGAQGLPEYAGNPDQFYRWAVAEAQRGNYRGSIEHFNKALNINPNFAPAYLGRGLAQFRLGNQPGAIADAQMAAGIFEAQNDTTGYEASQQFIQAVELAGKATEETTPDGDFGSVFRGVASIVMQVLLSGGL